MPKSSKNSSALAWVRLGTSENPSGYAIRYEDRLQRLIRNLNNINSQCPSLTLFLGNKNKNIALKQIFPRNSVRRSAEDYSCLKLNLDNVSKRTDAPVFFADGDPRPRQVGEHVVTDRDSSRVIALPWATEYGNATWATLLSLSIFPHADVICIFTEDCGGLDGTQDLLEVWADVAPTSQYHPAIRPHLILVNSDARINTSNIPSALLQPFSGCSIVSPGSLKANFEQAVAVARCRRVNSSMLFSAKHLDALLLRSMTLANQSRAIPFNVVQASRLDNPLSADYGNHLTSFMTLAKTHQVPHEAVCSFIASAILLDAYPPDMHRKFTKLPLLNAY
jgi:hypothetical protein